MCPQSLLSVIIFCFSFINQAKDDGKKQTYSGILMTHLNAIFVYFTAWSLIVCRSLYWVTNVSWGCTDHFLSNWWYLKKLKILQRKTKPQCRSATSCICCTSYREPQSLISNHLVKQKRPWAKPYTVYKRWT